MAFLRALTHQSLVLYGFRAGTALFACKSQQEAVGGLLVCPAPCHAPMPACPKLLHCQQLHVLLQLLLISCYLQRLECRGLRQPDMQTHCNILQHKALWHLASYVPFLCTSAVYSAYIVYIYSGCTPAAPPCFKLQAARAAVVLPL